MIKRLDHLEVAVADLDDGAQIYSRDFGFAVRKSLDGASATVTVGGAEIQLCAPPSGAPGAEGMTALWLEAGDLDQATAALRKAGVIVSPIRIENGRRILALDPKITNQVPLFIFDRRG